MVAVVSSHDGGSPRHHFFGASRSWCWERTRAPAAPRVSRVFPNSPGRSHRPALHASGEIPSPLSHSCDELCHLSGRRRAQMFFTPAGRAVRCPSAARSPLLSKLGKSHLHFRFSASSTLSFSAPNAKRRMPFCIYYPEHCLSTPKILSNVTFSNLVEIAVMEDASAIFNLISFPVGPIGLLNGIMNEFTGVSLLLSFAGLKGAIFWSMRQTVERQGELKFTFFHTCLTEYD